MPEDKRKYTSSIAAVFPSCTNSYTFPELPSNMFLTFQIPPLQLDVAVPIP